MAAVDADQNKQREMLDKEMTRSCVTNGAQILAEQEAKQVAESQQQMALVQSSVASTGK
jgi:hypothetical protein